ncbi:redoxin domain-containing protein [Cellulosimicrobium marinum]|uniref:redoxin domain-containing protein n=1 Tax=Cellulosimicrobium marinum TaxID=1638992 RepID=UPI001E427B47|nr:redoxin domain-containing protein [Cellulosimicrobium marinum]MCB7136597.1 redoxin domain-containing protein [Cellulosimicrobium marinum]
MRRTVRTLALVLVAGGLAACGGPGSPAATGPATSGTDARETASATTAPEDEATDARAADDDDAATTPTAVPEALQVSGTTVDGSSLDLASLAGEPVVLWFWAPWCTVCRGEAPDVAQVAADLEGEVTFVGVPGLGEVDAMRGFVADTGTGGFDHLVDADGAVWNHYGVVSQPSYVLVAPDGSSELVVGALGGDRLADEAARLAEG